MSQNMLEMVAFGYLRSPTHLRAHTEEALLRVGAASVPVLLRAGIALIDEWATHQPTFLKVGIRSRSDAARAVEGAAASLDHIPRDIFDIARRIGDWGGDRLCDAFRGPDLRIAVLAGLCLLAADGHPYRTISRIEDDINSLRGNGVLYNVLMVILADAGHPQVTRIMQEKARAEGSSVQALAAWARIGAWLALFRPQYIW